MESTRLYIINSLTFFITFTNIENTLKILLLLLSIIYTAVKIYEIFKRNEDRGKETTQDRELDDR
jgi:hypothetical protein